MTDLVIKRPKSHKLRVSVQDGRASVSVSGGPAPSDEEIDQIRSFLAGEGLSAEADRICAKLTARAV